jgi:hypothetical protein
MEDLFLIKMFATLSVAWFSELTVGVIGQKPTEHHPMSSQHST